MNGYNSAVRTEVCDGCHNKVDTLGTTKIPPTDAGNEDTGRFTHLLFPAHGHAIGQRDSGARVETLSVTDEYSGLWKIATVRLSLERNP